MDIALLQSELERHYPPELVSTLLHHYKEAKLHFFLGKWHDAEVDVGLACEAAFRIIEYACLGNFTPIGQTLPSTESLVRSFERSSADESYRLIIPRALFFVYTIRNKRGVGHLARLNPNEMDATCLIHQFDWIISEMYRQTFSTDPETARQNISNLIKRRIELVLESEGYLRILNNNLKLKDKILIYLYTVEEKIVSLKTMLSNLRYRNFSHARKILKELDKESMVEFLNDDHVKIFPAGLAYVESNYERWRR